MSMFLNLDKDLKDWYAKVTIDGDTFEWKFKNWKPYGKWKWILHLKNWRTYEGELKVLKGGFKWEVIYSNNCIYTWEFKKWVRNGRWQTLYPNNCRYEWDFRNNLYHWKWKISIFTKPSMGFYIEWDFIDWQLETWVLVDLIWNKDKNIIERRVQYIDNDKIKEIIKNRWLNTCEEFIVNNPLDYRLIYTETIIWIYEWPFKECSADWIWKLIHKNWDVYEWEFKNWRPHWNWKLIFDKFWISEWSFKNGKLEWKWKTSFPNWGTYEWSFKNGKPHWRWKIIYNNGSIYVWNFIMWTANWKWKLITKEWKLVKWVFELWKFIKK